MSNKYQILVSGIVFFVSIFLMTQFVSAASCLEGNAMCAVWTSSYDRGVSSNPDPEMLDDNEVSYRIERVSDGATMYTKRLSDSSAWSDISTYGRRWGSSWINLWPGNYRICYQNAPTMYSNIGFTFYCGAPAYDTTGCQGFTLPCARYSPVGQAIGNPYNYSFNVDLMGPVQVNYNSPVTLNWNVTGLESDDRCYGSSEWGTGSKSLSWDANSRSFRGSQSVGNLTSEKTFSLRCVGPKGEKSDSVTVRVISPTPTSTFSPGRTTIYSTETTYLNWSSRYARSCRVTKNGSQIWIDNSLNFDGDSGRINNVGIGIYRLYCYGDNGKSASIKTVNIEEKSNGVCGTANNHTFEADEENYTSSYRQCTSGIPSTTKFPEQDGSQTWTCSGTNGGLVSAQCIAYRKYPEPEPVISGCPDCGEKYLNIGLDLSYKRCEI